MFANSCEKCLDGLPLCVLEDIVGEHCNLLQGNYLHCPPNTTITAMLLFPNEIMHSSLLKGISLRIGSDMRFLP